VGARPEAASAAPKSGQAPEQRESFPAADCLSDEERVRRLSVEVERLAGLPEVEWLFYLDGTAETHGVDKTALKEMIKAVIRTREKKAREDRGELRRNEDRAEKKQAAAKRDTERKAREEERKKREAWKAEEKKEREKQQALAAIVKLPTVEHEAALEKLAKRFGESLDVLRAEFDELLGDEAEKIQRGIVEPWDTPVDTRPLLEDLMAQFARYIVVHDEAAATLIALWIAFTWCHDIATYSPILVVQGADADTAKTTACKAIALLTPRAHVIVEPTGPTLYRFVDRHCPTLIVDDADKLLPRRPDLAHIVNASWTRNTPIPRCDANGNIHLFDPFCPKVLNGIDLLAHLTPATRTRCITIDLLPKLASEEAVSFRRAASDENFLVLRRKLLRWATDNMPAIEGANPAMPKGFTNRLEENFVVLFAIADLADADWAGKARAAAVKLSRNTAHLSLGRQMLQAFYNIFSRHGALVTSKEAEYVVPMEAEVFADYRDSGRPINKYQIAKLLRPFRILPDVIHPRGRPADRGYDEAWFATAFKHYLQKTLPEGRTVVRIQLPEARTSVRPSKGSIEARAASPPTEAASVGKAPEQASPPSRSYARTQSKT
jgi:hypothetical protein